MNTTMTLNSCAMCGGYFPGPGVEAGGKVYCCDKCADRDQHKLHMLTAMAPKIMGMLAIGAALGYLLGRGRSKRS